MAFVGCIGNVNELEIHIAFFWGARCSSLVGRCWARQYCRTVSTPDNTLWSSHRHALSLCHPIPEHILSGHVPTDADFPCSKATVLEDTKPRTFW